MFSAVATKESWSPNRLARRATGTRSGWWGLSESAERYLDQLVTWRELGYNTSWHRPHDYDRYESLPAWARETLEEHARDERPHVYSPKDLERGRTHDALFNAAQGQLLETGWYHNTMRMLWGKKIPPSSTTMPSR